MNYTSETYNDAVRNGIFNVVLVRDVPGYGIHSELINSVPLSFEDATVRLQGFLKPLCSGVPGFQRVVDGRLEHIEGFEFASASDREEWLIDVVRKMIAKRNQETTDMMIAGNKAFRLWLADETDKAKNVWFNMGGDEKSFDRLMRAC